VRFGRALVLKKSLHVNKLMCSMWIYDDVHDLRTTSIVTLLPCILFSQIHACMTIWCACEAQDLEGLKFRFLWCYCPRLATFLSSETHLVITVSNLSNMCCLFHLLHKVCSEIHLIITYSNLLNLCYLFQLRCYSGVAGIGLDSDDPLPGH